MFSVIDPNVSTLNSQADIEINRARKLHAAEQAAKQAAYFRQQQGFGEALNLEDRLNLVGADSEIVLYLNNQPVKYPGDARRRIESHAEASTRAYHEQIKRATWLDGHRAEQRNALSTMRLSLQGSQAEADGADVGLRLARLAGYERVLADLDTAILEAQAENDRLKQIAACWSALLEYARILHDGVEPNIEIAAAFGLADPFDLYSFEKKAAILAEREALRLGAEERRQRDQEYREQLDHTWREHEAARLQQEEWLYQRREEVSRLSAQELLDKLYPGGAPADITAIWTSYDTPARSNGLLQLERRRSDLRAQDDLLAWERLFALAKARDFDLRTGR